MDDGEAGAYREFKALAEAADRKFARARDLPLYGGGDHHSRKAFKAYTRLWRLQQERRRELVAGGLRRWEIGEVASRIGQLYYARYLRTAEPRSLVGAYVFYEAIYSRGYFGAAAAAAAVGTDGGGGGGSSSRHQALLIRYKELRFIARFLVVAMLMRRAEAVDHLAGRLRALVEETKAAYPKTNFKEWKQVLQELGRFLKADGAYKGSRSLRYDNLFDSYPSNLASIARFHSKRVLKLKEAVLTSYRRNEIKFTELTLDTFRMLQCLEWEPTGSYQIAAKELTENGTVSDQSGPSGLIDIQLSAEISDGSLPSNPQKAVIYHPTVAHLLAASGNSSALFLTAAAQNLLCLKLAEELGVIIANPWVSWFKAASLPALASLLATPYLLYKVFPPETKDTPDAPALAEEKLKHMGPVTKSEWVMIGTMILAVSLWVCGDAIGVSSVVAAMLGLSILLVLGVLDWDDCLNEKSAWDTLAWFAVLVGMAAQLTNLGIVSWMSNCVAKLLQSFSLSWPVAFCVLEASYFLIHYLFASQTGHVGALYSAFLAMHIAAGVPGVLSALALAFNTNLFGAITHYSSGQAAVYFGAGYIELPDVFRLGFITALINTLIWGVVGTIWWKILGLY